MARVLVSTRSKKKKSDFHPTIEMTAITMAVEQIVSQRLLAFPMIKVPEMTQMSPRMAPRE